MTKKDKRTLIIEATLELITERGFHDTPMSVVADHAGVGAGTIYRYFKNKEALINELYAELKERMGKAMLENDEKQMSIKERFFNFWMSLYNHYINNPLEFLFLEQYANSPFISKLTKEENEKHYKPVIEVCAFGMDIGEIRKMPLELVTALIYGNVVSLVKLKLSEDYKVSDEEVQLALKSSWDSIKQE